MFLPAMQKKLNLVNPQMHNTVGVPPGGWVALRFIANNPGKKHSEFFAYIYILLHLKFLMLNSWRCMDISLSHGCTFTVWDYNGFHS